MPRQRLIWRILGAMLLVSIVPIGIGAYLQQQQLSQELTAANDRQMTHRVESAHMEISDYVTEAMHILKSTAAIPQVQSMNPAEQLPVLTAVDQENSDMAGLIVSDLTGMNVARSDGNAKVSVADRLYIKEVLAGKEHAVQTVLSKVSGKPTLIVAVPVKKDGKLVGVLYTNLQLDKVSKFVQQIKMGQTGFVWMADADDKIMTHPDPEKVKSQASVKDHAAIQRARSGDQSPLTFNEGGRVWASAQKVLPQGWVLVLQIDEAEILAPIQNGRRVFMWVISGVLAVGFLLAVVVARSLTVPIQKMAQFVGGMAQGDFTGDLRLHRADEIGFMADALRRMQESLRHHVVAVRGAVTDVSQTGRELGAASSMAAQAQETISSVFTRTLAEVEVVTNQQREQLEAAKGTFSELVSSIGQIANTASHQAGEVSRASDVVHEVIDRAIAVSASIDRIALSAERASGSAAAGEVTVEGALSGMRATRDHVAQAARTIAELGTRSEAISTILAEISAIADQTNLLALNAAIEAARAGDAGRGFAVVADEVRKLADRSVRSAQEIGKILASVHSGVKDAVTAMELGTRSADQGTARANEAQQALREILKAIETSVTEAHSVQEAGQHMSAGYKQLAETMQTLAAVTEENSAAAEEMAAGSESVRTTVLKLDTLATQNFAAISGVTGELDNISRAVVRTVEVAKRLEAVSESLEASAANLKG